VIGAGIAGLAAAAAVRDSFDRVVLVERDHLPAAAVARRGVAQGDQLHNLLARAQLHLEELLPGFAQQLREIGCGEGAVSADTHVFELGIRMPERDLGLRIVSARRPAIDHAARTLLDPTIEIIDESRVVDLVHDATGVSGVIVERFDDTFTVDADLVVDASGPAALAARWTTDSGMDLGVDEVHADQWYVSAEVASDGPPWSQHRFLLVFPTFPKTRGGLMSPAGDGTWHLSLSGKSDDAIPRSYAEMIHYAESLEDPVISERIAISRCLGEPKVYRKGMANWRRFDLLDRPIPGLMVVGDAFAGLNPLFGQGVSLLAWEASILREILRSNGFADRAATTTHYFAAAAQAVDAAWKLGELVSSALVVEQDGRLIDLTSALASLVAEDADLHALYVRIWHLLEPAESLKNPIIRQRLSERASLLREHAGAAEGTVLT